MANRSVRRGRMTFVGMRKGGMGYHLVPNALYRHRAKLGLDGHSMAVLGAILSHANGTDFATAACHVLAEDTGFSVSTVKRVLKKLREVGVETHAPFVKPGRQLTNHFDLRGLAQRLEDLEEERIGGRAPNQESAANPVSESAPLAEDIFGEPGNSPDPVIIEDDPEPQDEPEPAPPKPPVTPKAPKGSLSMAQALPLACDDSMTDDAILSMSGYTPATFLKRYGKPFKVWRLEARAENARRMQKSAATAP